MTKSTQQRVPLLSFLVVLAVLAQFTTVAAQGPAPSPDCQTALFNLSGCLTFVEPKSKLKVPEKECCPAFASLVDNTPQCLCQLLGKSNSFGVEINQTKALTLPTVCKVKTPSVTLCSVFGIPVGAPTTAAAPDVGEPVAGPIGGGGATTAGLTPAGSLAPPPGTNGGGSSFKISAFLTVGLSGAIFAIL